MMIFLPRFFEKKCVKLFPFFLPPKVLHYYHYDLFCFCRLSPHFFLSPLLLPGNIVGKGRKRKNEEESLLINSAKAGNCRRAKKWIEPASQDVCVWWRKEGGKSVRCFSKVTTAMGAVTIRGWRLLRPQEQGNPGLHSTYSFIHILLRKDITAASSKFSHNWDFRHNPTVPPYSYLYIRE